MVLSNPHPHHLTHLFAYRAGDGGASLLSAKRNPPVADCIGLRVRSVPQGWSRRCSELGRRASQRAPQRRGRQRRRERIRGGDVAGLGLGARSERVVGRRRIRRHRRLDRIDHLGEEGRGAPRARGWLRRREAIWDCVGAVRGGSRRHGRARARRFVRWCSPRPTAPEARRGAWHTEAQPLAGATHERWRWRWRVGGGAVRLRWRDVRRWRLRFRRRRGPRAVVIADATRRESRFRRGGLRREDRAPRRKPAQAHGS